MGIVFLKTSWNFPSFAQRECYHWREMLFEITNPIIYVYHMSVLQDLSLTFVPSPACEEDTGICSSARFKQ